MKIILALVLVFGFAIVGCKKDSQSTNSASVPEIEHKIPLPDPVDTLVSAPNSDTVSSENDLEKASR